VTIGMTTSFGDWALKAVSKFGVSWRRWSDVVTRLREVEWPGSMRFQGLLKLFGERHVDPDHP